MNTQIFEPNQYPLEPGTRLIEASAGTGKTFSLAHLVLRLITEKEYLITDMLIISFTKATASEIQSKISARIVLALKELEKVNHEISSQLADNVLKEWIKLKVSDESIRLHWTTLLLKALESVDHADITTIHGFCSKTLHREALELGNHINPEPLTETDNKQLILEIAHEYWKEQILELPCEQLKGLQSAGLSLNSLVRTILQIDNDPSLNFQVDKERIDEELPISIQFNDWISYFWESFVLHWENDAIELQEKLAQKAMAWKEMGITNIRPFSIKPKRNRVKEITTWIELFRVKENDFNSKVSIPNYDVIRENTLLKDYFHPSKISNIEDVNNLEFSKLLKPKLQQSIAELLDSPAELAWQHAISCSLKKLKERKAKIGFVSYSDQIKALDPENLKLSKNSSSILFKRLRERYKVIMVDEFQDTDPVQWRILNQTFSNSSEHYLLMIGDPKQSIYRFRGGDLNTYLTAKTEVSRIDSLNTNYRASPSLMESLNTLMKAGLKKSGLKVIPLKSGLTNEASIQNKKDSPIEIINLKAKSNKYKSSKSVLPSQLQVEELIPTIVTNSILKLLKSKEAIVNPNDICLLVNRHDQAETLRQYLTKFNLPSRLINQGDVLQSQASFILQIFLDCLSNPTDSARIKLLACSPLLQWNVDKLRASSQNGELDKLVLKCFELAEKLQIRGLSCCLSELIESKNIANLSGHGRLLGDIQQCAEMVQEIIHIQGLNAKGAAKWLRQQRQQPIEPTPESRRPNSDITEDAINIITIHRSKGLQYKIVICPYLWQSPPLDKGPLWKCKQSKSWYISLSTGWGSNRKLIKNSMNEAIEESERLAYVALTRAQEKLIVIWSLSENGQNNPLKHLLFGNEIIRDNQFSFSNKTITAWLNTTQSNIKINELEEPLNSIDFWEPPKIHPPLEIGPIPSRQIDSSWGRYSYSNWISKAKQTIESIQDPMLIEEGKDTEQFNPVQDTYRFISAKEEPLFNQYSNSPLASFPRGPNAGDCLHRILEKINFENTLTESNSASLIKSELSRCGIDHRFVDNVLEGFNRLFSVPLGGVLGNMQLNQLTNKQRIHELQFDMSLSQNGSPVQSIDLFNVFQYNPDYRFGKNYPELLKGLDISSKGILTGSIDLVFVDKEQFKDGQWWITDWKSNWIGKDSNNEEELECGPIYYSDKLMENQMLHHHYPLQAHVYLVALHKYLKWRLQNYDPSKHLGGYIYIFLRGIPSQSELNNNNSKDMTPGIIIEKAPIKRVLEFDKLISGTI